MAGLAVGGRKPSLLLGEHSLCPGCGEPVALRLLLEVLQELDIVQRTIGVVGHGCYGSFVRIMDVDVLQCLHGRAPACATGIKRMRPDCAVFTLQGDGDMVNEGLQEVLHAAARGEKITCVMLNNGVFGDTGGQQTATTVIGQRTKTSLDGPRPGDARLPGARRRPGRQAARRALRRARRGVDTRPGWPQTKRMLRKAFEEPAVRRGLRPGRDPDDVPDRLVRAGREGPGYQGDTMEKAYPIGELVPVTGAVTMLTRMKTSEAVADHAPRPLFAGDAAHRRPHRHRRHRRRRWA